MIFKAIHLREGLFERTIVFSDKANLIHSDNNSRGKTTLLRFLLYGLGYNIPNTKKIKFENCEVTLEIETEKLGTVQLVRNNNISIEMRDGTDRRTYVLPEQRVELHAQIWGTENVDILDNLMGAFYVDQEKGWTLLNRGVVIGSVHFNIEELVRGLSGTDCSDLLAKEARISREIGKYKQMYSVAQYREALEKDDQSLVPGDYERELDTRMDKLLIELRRIRKELHRIDTALSDNRRFKKYVADMKLLVQAPDGNTFRVTDQNIVGLNDSIDILIARRKITASYFAEVSKELDCLQREKNREDEQLSFFDNASQIETFDKTVSRLPLNPISIKRELSRLEKELKAVREEVSQITKINNKVAPIISSNIIKYATELGLGDSKSISPTYLFTSNLKELSGAILHKTAFAFRLAYIIAIESIINTKLPIILDSPSGKEIDPENVSLMMELLKRDFSDHQIIIASIYRYDFPDLHTIEISNRLIDSNTN